MRKRDAVVGVQSGDWTIVGVPFRHLRRLYVEVVCSCGTEAKVRVDTLAPCSRPSRRCKDCDLVSQREESGGDGRSSHELWDTWCAMIVRCHRPDIATPNWAYYGGRNIAVCQRWQDDFWAFVADMGERPHKHTLDRIDVNGNYEPDNVRWATNKQQAANKRHKKDIEDGFVPF